MVHKSRQQVSLLQVSDEEIRKTLELLRQQKNKEKQVELLRKKIQDEIDKVPEIREDRIASIREAVRKSEYFVSEEDVAKKMIGRILTDRIR